MDNSALFNLLPLFLIIFIFVGFTVQILGLIEAVSRPDFKTAERVGWTLAIFFFQLMGVIIYLFATDGKSLKTRVWLKNLTILNVVMILLAIVIAIVFGIFTLIMGR